MDYGRHYKSEDYGRDCYINYARQVCLAMERRLMDLEPKRSATFWRWFEEEIATAKYRMKTVGNVVLEASDKRR